MAQVLNLNPLRSSTLLESNGLRFCPTVRKQDGKHSWSSLQRTTKCHGKFTCLFSGSAREEQARKALESALGGKKDEFEKWNKEIKKREEAGGGGDSGGGGWFGWGGRFGGPNGDNFRSEALETILTILGIIVFVCIISKGKTMVAVVLNPLLNGLRGTRDGFTSLSSQILRRASLDGPAGASDTSKMEVYTHVSAKERVVGKWGRD